MPRPAEVWKCVPGCSRYEVSSWGRVRALERRCLRLKERGDGRTCVALCLNGRMKDFSVPRLVLRTFAGEPREGQEACHNDGNPGNNFLSNLRWDTHAAN